MPTRVVFAQWKQGRSPPALHWGKTQLTIVVASEYVHASLLRLHDGVGLPTNDGFDVDRVFRVPGSTVKGFVGVLSKTQLAKLIVSPGEYKTL